MTNISFFKQLAIEFGMRSSHGDLNYLGIG